MRMWNGNSEKQRKQNEESNLLGHLDLQRKIGFLFLFWFWFCAEERENEKAKEILVIQ